MGRTAHDNRPERALLGLRKELGLFANIRPAMMFEELADACPLKPELVSGGLDMVVVRELIGGIYFGERGTKMTDMGPAAYDVEQYSEGEVKRIAEVAFDMAMKRNKKVTSVDKANVLDSSRLWRRVVTEMAEKYPEVELNHFYVDNAAMQIVRNPKQFDVILTSNIFGDILSDEASQVTGSIGMLPSASLAEGSFGMYEPIHGSAPDIAGRDIARSDGYDSVRGHDAPLYLRSGQRSRRRRKCGKAGPGGRRPHRRHRKTGRKSLRYRRDRKTHCRGDKVNKKRFTDK